MFKGYIHPNVKIQSYVPIPMRMESQVNLGVNQTFLGLHSKTVLHHSPKQLNKMGICFKM